MPDSAAHSGLAKPHQSLRMDDLLKSRDPFYRSQTTREFTHYHSPAYGPHKATATFTNVGRETKFPGISLDMSNLPAPW